MFQAGHLPGIEPVILLRHAALSMTGHGHVP